MHRLLGIFRAATIFPCNALPLNPSLCFNVIHQGASDLNQYSGGSCRHLMASADWREQREERREGERREEKEGEEKEGEEKEGEEKEERKDERENGEKRTESTESHRHRGNTAC
jgi:hypothetical protein